MSDPTIPSPHQLWTEARGDPVLFRKLMIEHGHLIRRDKPLTPHPFKPSCGCGYLCEVCNLIRDHAIHTTETADGSI